MEIEAGSCQDQDTIQDIKNSAEEDDLSQGDKTCAGDLYDMLDVELVDINDRSL